MLLEKVIETKHVIPYYDIALETAKQSPCVRRKYGAVIASISNDIFYTAAANYRVSKCCDGDICVRDRFAVSNGQRVEIGGEVHAEQSALIRWTGFDIDAHWIFVIAGWSEGKQIYGRSCYPCHVCALMLKHAGFKHIYIKETTKEIVPISLNEIIAYRELEWETYDV